MPATTTPRLTAAETAHYRSHGYCVPAAPVFTAACDFAALVAHFDRLLASAAGTRRPEHLDVPHFADPRLFRWLLHDDVLDLVEPITGPDIALFSSHFICKPGGDGRRVPWHEDSHYWREMFVSREDIRVVTVWLAIDASDAGNGAMEVIPGTHQGGFSDYDPVPDPQHATFPVEIRSGLYDARRAVTLTIAPNHASLHDARLMHGSARNLSPRRRCAFTMRYMSSACRFDHAKAGGWHGIYLARGRDLGGNRYLDPHGAVPPALLKRGDHVRKGH